MPIFKLHKDSLWEQWYRDYYEVEAETIEEAVQMINDYDVDPYDSEPLYGYSKEDFLKKKDYIIELCEQYNARAYFWINPRNARKVALECIKSYADLITQGDCTKGFKVWDKKCGANPSSNYDRRWIVDVDTKDQETITKIYNMINSCRGKEEVKVVDMIQTFNGCHLITMGFDLHHFKQLCKIEHIDLDVHKDNPTLLYYAKV